MNKQKLINDSLTIALKVGERALFAHVCRACGLVYSNAKS